MVEAPDKTLKIEKPTILTYLGSFCPFHLNHKRSLMTARNHLIEKGFENPHLLIVLTP